MNFSLNKKSDYGFFLKIFTTILTISFLIYSIFLYNTYNAIINETDKVFNTVLKQKSKNINAILDHVESDINFLVEYVQNKIKNNDINKIKSIENSFLIFSKNHDYYQQLRFLDIGGNELVRVDKIDGKSIIKRDLQNKSTRYYYLKSQYLKEQEIYVSPLDLNIEYGKVEIPYKPMIRFSEPVFINGIKKGYVIINFSAQKLLESIKKSDDNINYILLNKSSYYLIGANNKEFGFMFNKPENTFHKDYPNSWNKILEGENSIFKFDNNYAHYLKYDPVNIISPNRSIKSDRQWYLISYYQNDQIYNKLLNVFKLNLVFLIPFFLVICIISYVLTVLKVKDIQARASLFKHKEEIESLLYEQSHLLSLFDIGDSTLFKWKNDENWSVEYVSENVNQLLEYSKTDFLNKDIAYSACIHKDDIKHVSAEVQYASKYNLDYFKHDTYRIITKSGKVKWVMDYTVTQKNESGSIEYFIGYISDITEMLDAQQRLQSKLQKFIDAQNSIVLLTNGKVIKFVNKAFLEYFGYKSLYDFKKDYKCICDKFIEQDNFFHLGKVKEDEAHWIDSLLNLSGRQRVVSMINCYSEAHAFLVSINNYENDDYVVNFSDISDNMIEKLELRKEATIDELTQLYNRVYFNKNIENILELHKNHKMKTGVIFFDIDHFKKFNDTYGHDVGDYVLNKVALLVKKYTRDNDKIIRWGGEEFIIISEIDKDDSLRQIAEHLRLVIEAYKFEDVSSVTCSFGCEIHNNEDEILETIKKADEKLYIAKESGRNKVEC